MKNVFIAISFCLLPMCIFSQASRTSVAVFPFVYAQPDYKNRASQLQEMVIELLNRKSNINVIDRSKDTLLLKELDFQIREQSIASKDLVQQGKILGAHDMIVGTVSNVKVEEQTVGAKTILKQRTPELTSFKANISFSLQLLDVESGKMIKQKAFSSKEAKQSFMDVVSSETAQTVEGAIITAMKITRKQIVEWLNESYPPDIRIIKIEERDKKGLPETILVSGIDASLAKGTKLTLNEIEMLDVGDGKKLRRSKKIADLRISDTQGEITVCKITEGEKIIEAKMTAGAKLEVLVN